MNQANLTSTPFQSIATNGGGYWSQDGPANEYYYNQSNVVVAPLIVTWDEVPLTKGTKGSLATSEWAWDAEYDRIYVRLDDTDPDTKADDTIKCSVPLAIVVATSNCIVFNNIVTNSNVEDLNAVLYVTDNADTIKVAIPFVVEDSKHFVDKVVLLDTDKLKIMTDQENISVLVSYIES